MRDDRSTPGSSCWTRPRRQSPLWIALKELFAATVLWIGAIFAATCVVLACFAVTAIVTAVANAVK